MCTHTGPEVNNIKHEMHETMISYKSENIPTGSPARGLKSAKSPLALAEAKSAKSASFSVGECFL